MKVDEILIDVEELETPGDAVDDMAAVGVVESSRPDRGVTD